MCEGIASEPLSVFADLTMGQSPDSASVNSERGLPFLQGSAEFGAIHPEHDVYCSQPVRVAKAGSTLISVRAPVGMLNTADRDYCIGRGLGAVHAKNGFDATFLAHAIEHNVDYLHRRSQGSTFLAINTKDLANLPIQCFEPSDQKKIGTVFSTINDAIEQTEALIAKTQQIKAGLMHDLFSRGVTPDGQLRPPREEAPHLYKESPLGWIPLEWEFGTLRSCLMENPTNGIYKPAELIGRGSLLVGQTAITSERRVDPALARRAVVSANELQRFGLAENDILVSRVFATVDGVGQPALVPILHESAAFESNMMRLRVARSNIRPLLLLEWLRTNWSRRFIVGRVNASNQASINQQVLNPLPVAKPGSEEQERIEQHILALEARHATEVAALRKLKSERFGLMHDLLTGRIRVPGPTPELDTADS